MKTIKRALSLVLALVVILSLTLTAIASNDINSYEMDIAGKLIAASIEDPNTPFKRGNYAVGEKIQSYTVENNQIALFEDAVHYIVYCNDIPSGIFTISGALSDEPTYTFGEGFINELVPNLRGNDAFSMIFTECQVFSFVDNNVEMIEQYDSPSLEREDFREIEDEDGNISLEPVPKIQARTFQVEEEFIPEEYSVSEIENLLETITIENTINTAVETLSVPSKKTRAFRSVGSIHQEKQASGSNYCWLISAKVMGEKISPKGYTASSNNKAMAQNVGRDFGTGGNSTDMKNILSTYYGLSSRLDYTITQAKIKSNIDTKKPVAMLCYSTNANALGHVVTCYGYNDSYSPYSIGVMDSLTGKTAYMTTNSGDYYITTGNVTYYWDYTLTVS